MVTATFRFHEELNDFLPPARRHRQAHDNNYRDSGIEAIAAAEGRVVLTRDRDLLKRRTITHGCYLQAIKSPEQLRELFGRLDLASSALPFTLCLHCKLPLRPVDKAEVSARLPPAVRASRHEFQACAGCRRVFWKGSHWARMCALLASVTGNTPF